MNGHERSTAALTPKEAAAAFAVLERYDRVVLAVSGGSDSTALMGLVAAWASATGRTARCHVATVDHGLRPTSAAEAAAVVAAATRLGLPAHVLTLGDEVPPTPFTQAWARRLRYQCLDRAAAADLGADQRAAIVTAHHMDDQAETVLMRLARGSGIDGLAAMRPVAPTADPRVDLVRPLLGIAKARLVATLAESGHPWSDDPSNTDERFERARWRAARPVLDGLGLKPAALALSAQRAARASAALDMMARALLADPALIVFEPLGFVRLDWQRLLRQPPEVRLRLLTYAIGWLSPAPLSLATLEGMTEGRHWHVPDGATLSHVQFVRGRGHVLLLPERGRLPPRPLTATAQRLGAFDCRGLPSHDAPDAPVLCLRPLDPADLPVIPSVPPAAARQVLLVQPAVVDAAGRLVSAPTLGFGHGRFEVNLRPRPGLANILHVPI